MYSKYKVRIWAILAALIVGGCAIVGLKYMMPIEKERAQLQKQRGHDTAEIVESVVKVLPEGTPPSVAESLETVHGMAKDVEEDAVKSERWHAAGEKIMGPPPTAVRAGTDDEDDVLSDTERKAETVGKVRDALNKGKQILRTGGGGGGLGGWLTGGGLVGMVTALGGAVEIGRRKLKDQERRRQRERQEDEEKHRKEQEARDEEQDRKMDTLVTMMTKRMDDLEAKLKKDTP